MNRILKLLTVTGYAPFVRRENTINFRGIRVRRASERARGATHDAVAYVNFQTNEMACHARVQVCQKLRLSRGITIVSSADEHGLRGWGEGRRERYEIFSYPARKFPPSLTKKYLMEAWMFRA